MTPKEKLHILCSQGMESLSLSGMEYADRLKKELKDIDNQSDHEYFINLHERKIHYLENENNLLVPYLLGICPEPNVKDSPIFIYGDMPDVDVDYVPPVRNYLKNEWAPKEFGVEKTCAIGNYTTFGIKSALIDMARVFSKDRKEILDVTTQLSSKDDDGKLLTFDKAVEMFPKLKEYCEANKDVADAAKRLLNRNRGMGVHAGGLIIANQRIDNLVPLVRGEDDEGNVIPVSAFVEGLHGTDLGPLGLVKYDMLVVTDLQRIADCCELIKQRHGLTSICALPGQDDWSDIAYLNDPKCMKVANTGNLKGIFQFDSDGIRDLCKKGGVDCFDDLVAYSALFRPGPMQMDMHTAYVCRKSGKEEYEIHPALINVLRKTYGVMVFQEQVMRILNIVGDIPLIFCEKIRKAMSKKKVKDFLPYKIEFVEHGQGKLSWDKEKVENLWDQTESFSEYGFNKSHSVSYTYISARLLWLKTHYPLEFFTVTLRGEKDFDKIKIYKREAQKAGIEVNKLDLNNSNWTFEISGNSIYIGFSKVKGIGEEVAKRIVASQTYDSFEHFLEKFGTDASILKPLIALGVFKEAERIKLYEFYEYYKGTIKKREDRDKRAIKSRQGLVDEFRYTLPEDKKEQADTILEKAMGLGEEAEAFIISEAGEDGIKPFSKYRKSTLLLKKKQEEDGSIKFADYTYIGKYAEDEMGKLLVGLPSTAEEQYYGFAWVHEMEYSPDYDGGYNFDQFNDDNLVTVCIECVVKTALQKKTSKKGNAYYTIGVEDENNKSATVTIWEEDYQRFKEEFEYWDEAKQRGHFFKMRLERPNNGFRSYSFDSPPKAIRHKIVPKDKNMDHRLIIMADPEVKKG